MHEAPTEEEREAAMATSADALMALRDALNDPDLLNGGGRSLSTSLERNESGQGRSSERSMSLERSETVTPTRRGSFPQQMYYQLGSYSHPTSMNSDADIE
jgi:hypothetical protein